MQLKIYDTKQEVAEAFAIYLAGFIASRKKVHIALSGGSTPKIVFDELAAFYTDKIDWRKVHFYWGDERCVSPDDVDSNYKMTLEHLLSKINVLEANIHRIIGENPPQYEAERYSDLLDKELPRSNKIPRFDLVILGMGDDGHTASIFPNEIKLWYSENNCEVATHPDSGQKRVSLSGGVINNAEAVVFLVTGESKAEKVKEIIDKEGDYKNYPAALVAADSGNLFWFLDNAAATRIISKRS
ncbi:MAG: 6-phosphogluconolactonase [Flavobacteriaceae bacterium]